MTRAVSPPLAGPDCPDEAMPHGVRVFDDIYEEHARFVWRSLRRLGVAEAHVADATQDVFVVVHRNLARFEQRSALRTWLFGIVLRVASDWRKKARRRPSEELSDGLEDVGARSPFEEAARSEATKVLYELLDQLSAEQRAVFVLVELEQLSVPEATEAIGANLHTVTSRLKAARKKFEAGLTRHQARNQRGRSQP